MGSLQQLPLQDVEQTVHVRYHSGDVVDVPVGYSTGWRTLPFACVAQTTYHSLIHLGQRRHPIGPGQACVIPQGVRHRIDQVGPTSGISRFAHLQWRMLGCIDALALFEVPLLFDGAVAAAIGTHCAELAAAHRREAGALQAIRLQALGLALLLTIAEASPLRTGGAAGRPALDRLRAVYAYIAGALGERITLRKLAQLAGLSPSRFHVVFKTMAGEGPVRFIQRLRMQRAQQLLIETDLTIQKIAAAVGLPDPFHFSRTFKRTCGAAPRDYRRTARSTLRVGPAAAAGEGAS